MRVMVLCVYIYIHTHIQREREKERDGMVYGECRSIILRVVKV